MKEEIKIVSTQFTHVDHTEEEMIVRRLPGGCLSSPEVTVGPQPVEFDEYNGMHGRCCK